MGWNLQRRGSGNGIFITAWSAAAIREPPIVMNVAVCSLPLYRSRSKTQLQGWPINLSTTHCYGCVT